MNAPRPIEIRRHTDAAPWTYSMKDQRQREIAAQIREGGPGCLLLSEVAPVITLGRRTERGDLIVDRQWLAQRGVTVQTTDRGGLATYHGPGQWVLFVVDSLERLTGDRRGVRRAVEGLLEVALTTARRFEPLAEIREGCETGVWSPRGKLASVGVHIEKGVLLHGLSLNVFKTETSFLGIRPCGLDAPVDYLTEIPAEFDQVGGLLLTAVNQIFSELLTT